MSARDRWISCGIVALAFALRVAWLDVKPAHFDEGVNGWFVDAMTRDGFYAYDPTNFHGPLHFYVLFVSQTLFGRSLWALRMPLVLVSTACVAMMLAFRSHLGTRVCQLAAFAMAISPGFSFYGRYAIHESELVFFLLAMTWGLAGLWREGTRRHLWIALLGVTGAVLTKETYALHFAAMLAAAAGVFVLESVLPSASAPLAPQRWSRRDFNIAASVCLSLIVFFYSGGLLHPRSLPGLWLTFGAWFETGTRGKSGHEHPWWYWLSLLARYEWPAGLGLLAAPFLVWTRSGWLVRFMTLAGLGAFVVYSAVAYKTPWCVISLIWPFYFVFALAVRALAERVDKGIAALLTATALAASAVVASDLNFRSFTDEEEPYVYVQTLPDIRRLTDPLTTLAARDAMNFHLTGHIVMAEVHPLMWLLGDFTHVDFPAFDELPKNLDADFLLIDEQLIDDIEPKLKGAYFKDELHIRGQANGGAELYLSAAKFAEFRPDRAPELAPPPLELKAP